MYYPFAEYRDSTSQIILSGAANGGCVVRLTRKSPLDRFVARIVRIARRFVDRTQFGQCLHFRQQCWSIVWLICDKVALIEMRLRGKWANLVGSHTPNHEHIVRVRRRSQVSNKIIVDVVASSVPGLHTNRTIKSYCYVMIVNFGYSEQTKHNS